MGLLDDVLGQLTGARDEAGPPAGSERGAPSDLGRIAAALMPVVLSMIAGSRRTETPGQQPPTGGGLGGLLGQMLGGTGAGGGLGSLLEQFKRAGFGDQVHSWVGTGQNQPISPDAVEQAFGKEGVSEIAQRAGVSEQDAARGLSQLMPELVDRMTPNGQVPDAGAVTAHVDAFAKRLGLS